MSKYIDAEKLITEIKAMQYLCNLQTPYGLGAHTNLEMLLTFIDSLQQEQPMPDSTKLIELWHKDKEMLKEKDFRDDPWRLAFNAFMCGFGRGIAVNKQEQPKSGCSEKPNNLREQPEVDLAKELDRYLRGEFQQTAGGNFNNYMQVARHFAEWGAIHLNARKEKKI